jgi:hypothetical protein
MREPLFDTARTVQNLETAYARMWENYVQGLGPRAFTVQPRLNCQTADPTIKE